MATTDFIAAIELGSSKISGMAGRKNSDGSIQVLAYARKEATTFMHKGVIYNIDKAAAAFKAVVAELEQQLDAKVGQLYVGIGGQSLHSIKSTVSRTVAEEENTVSQALVDELYQENRETPLADLCILDVVPQEYKVDHTLQIDPVGATGRHVTGQYLNLVARNSVRKNVEMAFEQAHIQIADDLIVSALTTARALLSQTEMRQGCAWVDLGAETTTVAIFKNNLLRYLCVIPMGGSNITRDLTTLKIEEEEAEQLKKQHGNAYYEEDEKNEKKESITTGAGEVQLLEFNEIVGARMEEILANVWNQIRYSGFENQLFAGTFFSGGGAMLKNIEESFRKVSGTERIKTIPWTKVNVQGMSNQNTADGTWCGIIGLLMAGHENCCLQSDMQKKEEESNNRTLETDSHDLAADNDAPNSDRNSSQTSTKGNRRENGPIIPDLFQDDEELKKQEEMAKQRREEERIRKAEEEKKAKEREREKKKKKEKDNPLKKFFQEMSENFWKENDSLE